ncbi:MAG: hypothetical protein HY329_08800 [Chloroflexi bacterium]|nr:hypothetical protein [Chloroflexota bacterium]
MLVEGRVVETVTVMAGQSRTWYPVPGTWPGFVGSVTLQGEPGSQLVAIVNELYTGGDKPGDTALAYEAFN